MFYYYYFACLLSHVLSLDVFSKASWQFLLPLTRMYSFKLQVINQNQLTEEKSTIREKNIWPTSYHSNYTRSSSQYPLHTIFMLRYLLDKQKLRQEECARRLWLKESDEISFISITQCNISSRRTAQTKNKKRRIMSLKLKYLEQQNYN